MIKFLRVRDVSFPEREKGNAGFDFFVPRFNESFMKACEEEGKGNPKAQLHFAKGADGKQVICIKPNERVCIPSGIKSRLELPKKLQKMGFEMDLFVENKSGIATKRGLDVGACEIDPNYQGEIHLSLTNTSKDTLMIEEGTKIVQLVPRVFCTEDAILCDNAYTPEGEFFKDARYNNRGAGGFGSTGLKAKELNK